MKRKRIVKINLFKLLVLITIIISGGLLIHDFIFWGLLPVFTETFYQLTYFGLFIDIIAIAMLDISVQLFKEWL